MSKQFYVKQFSLVWIQFQCQKTVLFQIIQFRINTQFKYNYGLIVKNISIPSYSVYSNNSVKHKYAISSINP